MQEKQSENSRIVLIGIIVEEMSASKDVNQILHEYADFIVGRMGVPYRDKGVNVISIVIDAENQIISALTGKLGMIPNISVKSMYAKTK